NGIAFSAYTDAGAAEAWVRFEDGGEWTEWHPMHLVFSATGGVLMGGYRGDAFRSGSAELRFSVAGDRNITVTGVGVFDNRKDADSQVAGPGGNVPSLKTEVSLVVDPPELITRAEWQAEPFIGSPVPLANPSYQYMTFHHAAGFSATTLQEGLAQVKAIQDLHQNVRGWSDIGYQFVVDRSGRLYQGRPFLDNSTTLSQTPRLALGAHVGGANTGNIGICLLGCYHPPEGSFCRDEITTASYDTYVQTLAFLSENYGVDPGRIRGHRDFSSTACPGDNNYALLCSGPDRDPSCTGPQLRVDVQNLLSTGVGRPTELTLAQNFPNPFTGSTTIDYYLTTGGIVTVKVYDSVGREVDTAVNGFQEGEQWYTIDFDGRLLAAGTYFVRLEVMGVGNNTSSRSSTMTVVN
ncbi:MAG: N-acetylmuramoyl-L-alanine amidase, partial [Rhodothermales bacterium]|nr:N-acetylmuramoyl-L-alanine amidase [Rhodothermales bacterium]